ncbi:MAG TPA: c-type cytochrome [Gemmatimonadales bacterium]|jgi:cytochrome c oxidase cbb3-type subunit 3|nr:c-type cytochrome [Gemmatimonadales bacterium]
MGPLPASLFLLALAAASACDGAGTGGDEGGGPTRGAAAATPPAVRYDQHVPAGGIAPPGINPVNPFTGQKPSAAEGERLFGSMNCDGCHGGGASGWVGPSLSDGRWRYGGSDAAIFQSIYYGRPRGMPAYGGILSRELTWKLVTYLQSLPLPRDLPTEAW